MQEGLSDLCAPEARRKAGAPWGNRQNEKGGQEGVQSGGLCHTGALGVWMMGTGCVPSEHAGHGPPPPYTPQTTAKSSLLGQG